MTCRLWGNRYCVHCNTALESCPVFPINGIVTRFIGLLIMSIHLLDWVVMTSAHWQVSNGARIPSQVSLKGQMQILDPLRSYRSPADEGRLVTKLDTGVEAIPCVSVNLIVSFLDANWLIQHSRQYMFNSYHNMQFLTLVYLSGTRSSKGRVNILTYWLNKTIFK